MTPGSSFPRAAVLLMAAAAVCVAAEGQQAGAGAAPATPIAIVPSDSPATVTGSLQVADGKTLITGAGTITSGAKTTEVILPRRGVLRVCASTAVKLTSDPSAGGDAPGLMMALNHGALETSFATGRDSDILLTPDFRILLGADGASQVKVRLGPNGDTCVDNPGPNAPYVVVTSVFEGGLYRVQPGQRVMFEHGSIHDVVDQEKEPCGCPGEPQPGTNDFPLAASAGLAPLSNPALAPKAQAATKKLPPELSVPMVYEAKPLPLGPEIKPQAATAAKPAVTAPKKKRPGFFRRIGGFLRKVFGAE